MKHLFLSLFLLVAVCIAVNGQTTTITISTGTDWTDATLIKSLKSSESSMATTNYSSYPRLAVTAWNHSNAQISYRTLLKFDHPTIPIGTVVQSATLYVYSDPANSSGEFSNSGSNLFYIQKVPQTFNKIIL